MEGEAVPDADRVLVGVDGSHASIDALRYAARMAEAFDAPLDVMKTWAYPPAGSPYIADAWSPEEEASTVLDQSIAAAFGDSPPPLRRIVRAGPAARVLIDESRRCGMLVVGSRGRGGFAGLLLGSVSSACAEHAHCPVLVVHASTPDHDAPEPGSGDTK